MESNFAMGLLLEYVACETKWFDLSHVHTLSVWILFHERADPWFAFVSLRQWYSVVDESCHSPRVFPVRIVEFVL
jgi:hypothetical protein